MAYESAVTLDTPHAERISRNLGILIGSIDVTKAHATASEETDITDCFKTLLSLQLNSSENGYMPKVDVANGKVYFYEAGTDGAELDAVGADTDVGTFDFIAIGTI